MRSCSSGEEKSRIGLIMPAGLFFYYNKMNRTINDVTHTLIWLALSDRDNWFHW